MDDDRCSKLAARDLAGAAKDATDVSTQQEVLAAVAKQNQLDSVERVMKVLDCFTLETPELRLTDISALARVPKTQALRIASTLEAGQYLIRAPDTKRYRLGLRVFQLGVVARESMSLQRAIHPLLEKLVEATQETARFVVADEHGPVCVDLIESPRGVRVYAQLGDRMPWNAGTSGKVILAFLPEEDRNNILAHEPLRPFNEQTITNPDALRHQLETIRAQGYHLNEVGDFTEETRAIAAPVFKDDGKIAGAISLTAPASRWQQADVERYIQLVVDAGLDATNQLSHSPQSRARAMAPSPEQPHG